MTRGSSFFGDVKSRWYLVAVLSAALLVGFYVSYAWAATYSGTNGNDTLNGSNSADDIYGLDGNDDLYGHEGNDEVLGNADIDKVYGMDGNDSELHGGPGDDRETRDGGVYGNAGQDFVYGDGGIDTLYGGPQKDVLDGGTENDALHANDGGEDFLYGGTGINNCWYDAGTDHLAGCNGTLNPY